MSEEKPPYSVALEAKDEDIPAIRDLLEQIELVDDVRRFRIEIDSDSPIFSNNEEETTEESQEETKTSEAEPVKKGFQKFNGNSSNDSSQNGCKVKTHTEKPRPGIKPLKIGTNKFKVMAFLYRQNEPLRLSHIQAYLEGTDWEINYKSLSSTLSKAKGNGLVEKGEIPNCKYEGWTLSDKGQERMAKTVEESDGYILTIADKIAGLHPTDNFPQPELKA